MGCVSSHVLQDDNGDCYARIGGGPSSLGHHIVSLTSTTYGLLTLDPPQRSELPGIRPPDQPPDVINSWELMAGLDNDSFRFPLPSPSSDPPKALPFDDKENSNPQAPAAGPPRHCSSSSILKPSNSLLDAARFPLLEKFEKRCPPGGENAVVIYTTTLRGIRKTFEDCNAVRSALQGAGVRTKERDVSMHQGFREELRGLLAGEVKATVPRVFVGGRYIGGAEEVLRLHEQGLLGSILEGMPKAEVGAVCDGCGGARFLPCSGCHGSCKVAVGEGKGVERCPECNENGLVLCPICS